MKTIKPSDLIALDDYQENYPLRVELAYAYDKAPNIFGQIYREDAKLWLHKDLAEIVLRASLMVHEAYGYNLVLYDGLRTVEAQVKMQQSAIVRAHPQWLQEPGRLLSPPGAGAHPRGMAIDLTLEDEEGRLLPMGTVFDHLAADSSPEANPAHREFKNHPLLVHQNRMVLNNAMLGAAEKLNMPLTPLPQEWWDYRFPAEIYSEYSPLYDKDLPREMKMTE